MKTEVTSFYDISTKAEDEDEDEVLHNAVAAAETRLARKLLQVRLLEARLAESAADERLRQLDLTYVEDDGYFSCNEDAIVAKKKDAKVFTKADVVIEASTVHTPCLGVQNSRKASEFPLLVSDDCLMDRTIGVVQISGKTSEAPLSVLESCQMDRTMGVVQISRKTSDSPPALIVGIE